MERLKHIKEALVCCVESQMDNLKEVDTKELGEAIDMVKDIEQAMYYCSIVKAMEENDKEGKVHYVPVDYYRDMDKGYGRMYYNEDWHPYKHDRYPKEEEEYYKRKERKPDEEYGRYPMELRDSREGKSPISRKNYMESKELHKGTPAQMKELEKYVQELSQDITEMIADATPEEKAILQQKLSTLAAKIK